MAITFLILNALRVEADDQCVPHAVTCMREFESNHYDLIWPSLHTIWSPLQLQMYLWTFNSFHAPVQATAHIFLQERICNKIPASMHPVSWPNVWHLPRETIMPMACHCYIQFYDSLVESDEYIFQLPLVAIVKKVNYPHEAVQYHQHTIPPTK